MKSMPRPERHGSRSTLVITAVGSGVGRTLLQALGGRRQGLRLVGLGSEAEVPELYDCDAAWLVPPTADAASHRARLLEVIAEEGADLVVPGRDEDVLALAELRDAQPALAARLLVGPAAAARVLVDKSASAAFAQTQGLPFVPTVDTGAPDAAQRAEALLANHGFPLIAKPANGNGSRGVRVLLDRPQLRRQLGMPATVLQPMIDAPPRAALQPDLADGVPLFWGVPEERLFAVRGWIGLDARPRAGCAYVMRMTAGRFDRMALVDDPALHRLGEAYGLALAAALHWRGPYHLQCKRDAAGRYWPIELHGRFGGGTAGRAMLGHDEAGAVLRHWLGERALPAQDGPPGEASAVHLRPHDAGVPRADRATLVAHGRWPALR
jgi:hypothetical protein